MGPERASPSHSLRLLPVTLLSIRIQNSTGFPALYDSMSEHTTCSAATHKSAKLSMQAGDVKTQFVSDVKNPSDFLTKFFDRIKLEALLEYLPA